jgi:hypothetical protein
VDDRDIDRLTVFGDGVSRLNEALGDQRGLGVIQTAAERVE